MCPFLLGPIILYIVLSSDYEVQQQVMIVTTACIQSLSGRSVANYFISHIESFQKCSMVVLPLPYLNNDGGGGG